MQDAWAGQNANVLLSKIGPYKLFYWDIQQAGPNMELESEVQYNDLIEVHIGHCMYWFNCFVSKQNNYKCIFLENDILICYWL